MEDGEFTANQLITDGGGDGGECGGGREGSGECMDHQACTCLP